MIARLFQLQQLDLELEHLLPQEQSQEAAPASLDHLRDEIETKRAQLAASIDSNLLDRYQTLRRSRQGRAVSRIEHAACQWCQAALVPSEMQRVQYGRDIETCPNCSRILYFEE